MADREIMQWSKNINNILHNKEQLGNFIIAELFVFITKNKGGRTKQTPNKMNKLNTCNKQSHSSQILYLTNCGHSLAFQLYKCTNTHKATVM